MFRLASSLAVFVVVCATLASRPAHAAPVAGGKRVTVFIWLKGSSLGSDPHFRVRTARTHFRDLLDVALPSARWYSSKMHTYQQDEVAYLRSQHIDIRVTHYYSILLNGMSASVPASQIGLLRKSANVSAVTRQRLPKSMLDKSISLIHAQQAWPVVGGETNAGKGVFIAQVDSGIDINNPCFGDKGMAPPPSFLRGRGVAKYENNKVVVARVYGPNPKETYSAADVNGHGTFGAAVEACDSNTRTPVGTTVSGVAPAAYLMSYNVYPGYSTDESYSYDPDIAAFEDAVADGADVINFSSGYGFADDYRLDPEEQALEVAVKNGVSVVVSAGNAGPTTQTVSSPSTAPDVISAGATTNSHALYTSVDVGGPTAPPASIAEIQDKPGDFAFSTPVGPAQVVDAGYGRMPGDQIGPGEPAGSNNVDDFAGKDFHGKIALIERGKRFFETKLNNAKKAGAIGAIVYDNSPSDFQLTVMGQASAKIPAVFVSYTDGQALLQWTKAHPDSTATLNTAVKFFNETPNLLSDFSSRGYGPNYSIKPDVVAPGQDIYSATENEYPKDSNVVNQGEVYDPSGFTTADGTSFSAPHTTGEVTLLKELHPKWTPAMIKATIMDTSQMTIHEETDQSKIASVMESGAGLIDAQAAVNANAYLLPSSVSFGAVNRGYGPVQQTVRIALRDVGGGSGAWQGHVSWLHGTSGVSVAVPSSVSLAANGSSEISLQLNVSSAAAAGDYDGYAIVTNGAETLHVPFFVHVSTTPVKKGSVLLVDVTQSLFQAPYPEPPVKHLDVTKYYTNALTHIGKNYTYWNEYTQGTPTLADMKNASVVIYFTGANLNDFAAENGNSEATVGPLSGTDSTILHQYLDAGGHVFITGKGSVLSVPYFMYAVVGVNTDQTSLFDTAKNDLAHTGTVSPPKPSTHPDAGLGAYKHVGPFLGLKPIDLSSKGDGARTNLAVYNSTFGSFFGIPGLKPVRGSDPFFGNVFGQWGMAAPKKLGLVETGVTASDEPTLTHAPKYKGRSVTFSFGFEGINNNTGFATREQVLRRIFQWFNDKPNASVSPAHYAAGQSVTLRARLKSKIGTHAAAYQWEIGSKKLAATSKPTTYRFGHAGTFRARVLVTDNLGHASLSPWVKLRVG